MTESRSSNRLLLVGMLVLVTAVMGWLLLGFAWNRTEAKAPSEIGILRGNSSGLDPEEVAARPETDWKSWSGAGFVTEKGHDSVWVRVILRNETDAAVSGVLVDAERYADRVDLFARAEAADPRPAGIEQPGGWLHLRSGEWTPARERALWGRETAFPLTVLPHSARTIYLRYEDQFAVWLDLNWWAQAGAFHSAIQREMMAEGCYFGLLLALLFYNAVLWVRFRFSDLGNYLLYLGTFVFYALMTRSVVIALGGTLGSPWMEMAGAIAQALSGVFLAEFCRQFLELPVRAPRVDRLVRGVRVVMTLLAAGALAAPMIGYPRWLSCIVLGTLVTHLTLFGAAVIAWRRGAWQARNLVLAFAPVFSAIFPAVAVWLHLLPLQVLIRWAMLGWSLEMLLLSFVIAERFARLQREKIAAQTQAMEEAERREQIQEAYADELEHEVRARTHELAAANADKDRMMAVLGHDLRSPLTALTLLAEQAVRDGGSARPDFATETVQTGRALLLLLEDVVLWARLRAEAGKAANHAAASVVVPATELHRTGAAQRAVTLNVATPPELRVRVDLVLAQTLVRNLTSNAIKSARSRVTVAVTDADLPSDRVRVSVQDDGPGLPPEMAAYISGSVPGRPASTAPWGARTGLGLQLCVEIAQAIGTQLETVETNGGGAEVSFTLPRAET